MKLKSIGTVSLAVNLHTCDIDTGKLQWLASGEDFANEEQKEERKNDMQAEYTDKKKVVF